MKGLAGLSFLAIFCSIHRATSSQQNVDLSQHSEYELSSVNYPDPIPSNTQQEWSLSSPPGTKIHFSCYDIRLHQEACGEEAVIIDDGERKQEICGTRYDLDFITPGNKLRVELRTGSYESGGMTCTAKIHAEEEKQEETETAPTEIRWELKPGGQKAIIESMNYPSPIPPSVRQSWFLSTSPGARIRITCTDIRLRKDGSGKCTVDTLTVIDGETREICGSQYDFSILSSDNKLTVHLKTAEHPSGGVRCEVSGRIMDWYGEATTTTTTTPTPPPYIGIESEEVDSSEHGVAPGKKNTTCNCGWSNKASKRVVNGRETEVNEYPFMAALVYRGYHDSFCGATIISHYHALTAAHCTYKPVLNGNELDIIIGEHDQASRDETDVTEAINVEKIIQHENYDPQQLKNDISLLVLAKRLEFSKYIGPACLSKVQLKLTRQYVRVIGWGLTSWSGNYTTKLQKVDTRVIHMESCHERYNIVSVENPTQICVYSHQKSACMGDSGGPVVWVDPETNRYTQVGLVSFGRICAGTDPAVYTDVSAFMKWIMNHISANRPDDLCFKCD